MEQIGFLGVNRHSKYKDGKFSSCQECGQELVQTNRGQPRKFCGGGCRDKYHNRVKADRKTAAYVAVNRPDCCRWCRSPINQPPSGRPREYCSKECKNAAWRKNNVAHDRSRYRAWSIERYGITADQYEEMLNFQKGRCAICGNHPNHKHPLHIDHDHDTGAVRQLLCARCNTALGLFKEDESTLVSAIEYLRRWGK